MLDRYLWKRPRSAFWQLRVPVPKDVQKAFGRAVVTRSLREHDRERAADKALPILVGLKNRWAELRAGGATDGDAPAGRIPTHAELIAIAQDAFNQGQAVLIEKRASIAALGADTLVTELEFQEREQVKNVALFDAEALDQWIEPAERMLKTRGFALDRKSTWFKHLIRMLGDTSISSIDVTNRRARGDLTAEPASEVLAEARRLSEAAAQDQTELTFSALAETFMRQWLASASDRKQTNTEQQKRATFKLFRGFWDDRPIRGVRQRDAALFRDQLKLLHPNWARSPTARSMSWKEVVLVHGDQPRGLSDATMNRHMRTLQSLWEWAKRRGHCAGDNPFQGFHKKLRRGVNVDPYVAWLPSELATLFDPPPRRSDVLEIIIVAMFSGMRLDEIASLKWGALQTADEDGSTFVYFRIDDAKTPAGMRDVPVHPTLRWLLERTREPADARIWPGFNEEGVGKKAGADAGREFSRFKADRGFKQRNKVFHSFRKNVTRIMERAGVSENDWAQVFGHEPGFTYSVYNPDGISLRRKAEIIALIDYPGLAVPHPAQ